MKTQIWVYIVVGLLSVGAGVAIAGLPNSEPREPTIQPPTTTETTIPELESDTESLFQPSSGNGSDASGVNDEPAIATDATPTDESAETGADTATTDSVETSTTSSTSTTSTSTTSSTTVVQPDRAVFDVVVVNGAGRSGVATGVASLLEADGYVDVRSVDGQEVVETSVVYAGSGLEAVAIRLAGDADLGPESVLPLDDMPDVAGLDGEQLVVYLGSDVLGE